MIEAQALAALVPHSGAMCLLDALMSWNEARVICSSASHRRPDHPLRRGASLSAIVLLEYAAQATAVHGALAARAAGTHAPVKLLAAARDFDLHVARLDDVKADLHIDAERLLVMGDNAMYRFRVTADDRLLAEGRLTIVPSGGSAS